MSDNAFNSYPPIADEEQRRLQDRFIADQMEPQFKDVNAQQVPGAQNAEMYANTPQPTEVPANSVVEAQDTREQSRAPEITAQQVELVGFLPESADRQAIAEAVGREIAGRPKEAAPAAIIREAARSINPFDAESKAYSSDGERAGIAERVVDIAEQVGTLSPQHAYLNKAYEAGEVSSDTYHAGVFAELIQAGMLKRGQTATMGVEAMNAVDSLLADLLKVDKSQVLGRIQEISTNLKGMFYNEGQMKVTQERFDANYIAYVMELQRLQDMEMVVRMQAIEERKKKNKKNRRKSDAKFAKDTRADLELAA